MTVSLQVLTECKYHTCGDYNVDNLNLNVKYRISILIPERTISDTYNNNNNLRVSKSPVKYCHFLTEIFFQGLVRSPDTRFALQLKNFSAINRYNYNF